MSNNPGLLGVSEWVCYMIISLDLKYTYIGSTNNFLKRLCAHNHSDNNRKRLGAKRTRGRTWIPVIIISGFNHKNACLSFESGWKRLFKKRSNNRFQFINLISDFNIKYSKNAKWNRVIDLLYFVHNFTLLGTKFKINHNVKYPINVPDYMLLTLFLDEWINELPWPYFVSIQINNGC